MKETIPKIIHQIHLGTKELSNKELEWREGWKRLNPEWGYILWDELNIRDNLKINHPGILNRCKSYSEKSDVLRFDILHQYGGLYIDTDFQCLRPIHSLFVGKEIVLYRQRPNKICGAFFGATKNNNDVKKLIDGLPRRERTHGKKIACDKYGPMFITKILGKNKAMPDGEGCSYKTVYPYLWTESRQDENFLETHPEAFAVHHWFGSWNK